MSVLGMPKGISTRKWIPGTSGGYTDYTAQYTTEVYAGGGGSALPSWTVNGNSGRTVSTDSTFTLTGSEQAVYFTIDNTLPVDESLYIIFVDTGGFPPAVGLGFYIYNNAGEYIINLGNLFSTITPLDPIAINNADEYALVVKETTPGNAYVELFINGVSIGSETPTIAVSPDRFGVYFGTSANIPDVTTVQSPAYPVGATWDGVLPTPRANLAFEVSGLGAAVDTGSGYVDNGDVIIFDYAGDIAEILNGNVQYLDNISSNVQGQLDSKVSSASPTFTGTSTFNGDVQISSGNQLLLDTVLGTDVVIDVNNVEISANELAYLDGLSTTISGLAPLASPTFSGTVTLPETTTNIGVYDLNSKLGEIAGKAPSASPTLTGTITLNGNILVGDSYTLTFQATPYTDTVISVGGTNISAAELSYLDTVSSNIQTQLNSKIGSASPTITGTLTIDNTYDYVLGETTGYASKTVVEKIDLSGLVQYQTEVSTYDCANILYADLANSHNSTFKWGMVDNDTLYTRRSEMTASMDIIGTDYIQMESTSNYGANSSVKTETTGNTDARITILATLGTGSSSITTYSDGVLGYTTITGRVSLPSDTSIGNVNSTEIDYLDGVTSAIQTQLDNKQSKIHTITTVAGTTHTLLGTEDWIKFTSNSGVTFTIDSGEAIPGYIFTIFQQGTGQITWSGTAAIRNADGHTKTYGQYASVTFECVESGEFIASGRTA